MGTRKRIILPRALARVVAIAVIAGVWQGGHAFAQSSPILERIQKEGELRLAYRADAAPFSYKEADKPAGYSVNLCLEVAAALQEDLKLPKLTARFPPPVFRLPCRSTSSSIPRRLHTSGQLHPRSFPRCQR